MKTFEEVKAALSLESQQRVLLKDAISSAIYTLLVENQSSLERFIKKHVFFDNNVDPVEIELVYGELTEKVFELSLDAIEGASDKVGVNPTKFPTFFAYCKRVMEYCNLKRKTLNRFMSVEKTTDVCLTKLSKMKESDIQAKLKEEKNKTSSLKKDKLAIEWLTQNFSNIKESLSDPDSPFWKQDEPLHHNHRIVIKSILFGEIILFDTKAQSLSGSDDSEVLVVDSMEADLSALSIDEIRSNLSHSTLSDKEKSVFIMKHLLANSAANDAVFEELYQCGVSKKFATDMSNRVSLVIDSSEQTRCLSNEEICLVAKVKNSDIRTIINSAVDSILCSAH